MSRSQRTNVSDDCRACKGTGQVAIMDERTGKIVGFGECQHCDGEGINRRPRHHRGGFGIERKPGRDL